jgi:hypothetical protein
MPANPPSLSSQSPFPEEVELDRGAFSDKTWPRSSAGAKLLAKYSEQLEGSGSSSANPSPKSEGTPTRYEQIGDVEERAGDESPLPRSREHSSPSHTLQSNSDSLLTPKSNHTVSTYPDSPEFCLKYSGAGPSVDEVECLGTPSGGTDSPDSRVVSTEQLMVSTGLQVKSRRSTYKASPPLNDASTGTAQAGDDSSSQLGQEGTDAGGISSYIARMRQMGHRRASSAPIKEVAKNGSSAFTRRHEGEGDVFLSPGREGVPVDRGKQMV